ncbi:unnamed protein product [Amaranthus hypochondriacus]
MNLLNPQTSNSSFSTESYQTMLQESINIFLSQHQSGISDFSHFNLMFSRIIHTMPSPPIELIWFHSAVNYHTHKNITTQDVNLGRIFTLKELFHSLNSCTGPCSSSLKKVAILAPLTFELYNLVSDLRSNTKSSLDEVIKVEIGCFVEGLVSFISLCCCEAVDDHDDALVFSPCFVDLVKVWTIKKRESRFAFEDDVKMFFPVISGEVHNELLMGGRVGLLAGIVMYQTFLLYLCLKFVWEDSKEKLKADVLSLAVSTISGFRSCYFFDILLKMLLESSLPVLSLLTAVDEVLLREAIFDAIILEDLFDRGCGIRLCSHHSNILASTWLFVADKAMQFVRCNGDHDRLVFYMKAFSKSFILSQLLKWVSTQIVKLENANKINFSTPTAFMEWLLQVTSQASRCFSDEFSMLLEKAMNYLSDMKRALPCLEPNDNHVIFDHKECRDEDHEMIDSTEGAKTSCDSNFAGTCRKRKGERDEGDLRVKLFKYQIHDSPIKNILPFQNEVGLIRRSYAFPKIDTESSF